MEQLLPTWYLPLLLTFAALAWAASPDIPSSTPFSHTVIRILLALSLSLSFWLIWAIPL